MPPTNLDLLQQAFDLLSADSCIWCEDAPKAPTSHLCVSCRAEDPGGLLRRPAVLTAVPDAAAA